jgi:hypothetical protein
MAYSYTGQWPTSFGSKTSTRRNKMTKHMYRIVMMVMVALAIVSVAESSSADPQWWEKTKRTVKDASEKTKRTVKDAGEISEILEDKDLTWYEGAIVFGLTLSKEVQSLDEARRVVKNVKTYGEDTTILNFFTGRSWMNAMATLNIVLALFFLWPTCLSYFKQRGVRTPGIVAWLFFWYSVMRGVMFFVEGLDYAGMSDRMFQESDQTLEGFYWSTFAVYGLYFVPVAIDGYKWFFQAKPNKVPAIQFLKYSDTELNEEDQKKEGDDESESSDEDGKNEEKEEEKPDSSKNNGKAPGSVDSTKDQGTGQPDTQGKEAEELPATFIRSPFQAVQYVATEEAADTHCPHCGKALEPDSDYCPHCGGKLVGIMGSAFELDVEEAEKKGGRRVRYSFELCFPPEYRRKHR